MKFNLVNYGQLVTKDKRVYFFIDILCRDEVSHTITLKRCFIGEESYKIFSTLLVNDIDIFTFDMSKYIAFGFNFKNECCLQFYEKLFLNDMNDMS